MQLHSRIPKSIGKKIKAIRKAKEVTQEDLASKVGISLTYVGYIEQGRRLPSLKTMDKIARFLKVKLSDILD